MVLDVRGPLAPVADLVAFGRNVQAARLERGLSVYELGAALAAIERARLSEFEPDLAESPIVAVGQSGFVRAIEAGEIALRLDAASRFADALGLPVEALTAAPSEI